MTRAFLRSTAKQTGLVEVEDLGHDWLEVKNKMHFGGPTKGIPFMLKFHICSVVSEES